jgi:hypothetical protein
LLASVLSLVDRLELFSFSSAPISYPVRDSNGIGLAAVSGPHEALLTGRWDEGDALPMATGCFCCPDLGTCGGMHKKQDAYWCLDDCCGKPDTCDGMCPNNPVGFRDRMREVNGLELDNIPRGAPCPAAPLPTYVPYLYHGSRRAKTVDLDTVALPLRNFHSPDGRLRFKSRAGPGPARGMSKLLRDRSIPSRHGERRRVPEMSAAISRAVDDSSDWNLAGQAQAFVACKKAPR